VPPPTHKIPAVQLFAHSFRSEAMKLLISVSLFISNEEPLANIKGEIKFID
jgi:hypothetical protein